MGCYQPLPAMPPGASLSTLGAAVLIAKVPVPDSWGFGRKLRWAWQRVSSLGGEPSLLMSLRAIGAQQLHVLETSKPL